MKRLIRMRITNATRNKVLSTQAILCTRLLQRGRGLMFSEHRDLVFIFAREQYVPLHMLFVFHPIDVIYCDREKRVTELVSDLKPWRFHSPKKMAQYVLELSAGTIRRSATTTGDLLEFA